MKFVLQAMSLLVISVIGCRDVQDRGINANQANTHSVRTGNADADGVALVDAVDRNSLDEQSV